MVSNRDEPRTKSQGLAHCRGFLWGLGIGCLGGLVLGPLVGLVGYLIGNPLFDSEIGPMPVLWALGFDGLFAGGFLGVIAGAVIDVVRERSAPAVLALLGLLAMAAPIVILIVLALMC